MMEPVQNKKILITSKPKKYNSSLNPNHPQNPTCSTNK